MGQAVAAEIDERRKTARLFLSLAISLLSLATAAAGGFTVQGRLTDVNGVNRDGAFQIKFSIYPGADGTEPALWEKTVQTVSVRNGNFQVILADPATGGQNPALSDALAGDSRYLEFQVLGGNGLPLPEFPLAPRMKLISVPFAFLAQQTDEAPVPRGIILAWSGGANNVPQGWCLCDGRTCQAADGTQVATPDLSDRFILGANAAAEIGAMGGTDTPVIDPPATFTSQIKSEIFWDWVPGLTNSASKVRWHLVDVPAFSVVSKTLYPKYFKLGYIMKL